MCKPSAPGRSVHRTPGPNLARSLAGTLAGTVCALLLAAPAQAAEPGRIVIEKTDQFADPVAGAVFEAFASDGDGVFEPDQAGGDAKATECTSDAGGTCALGPLVAGEYFVRELSAPAGYTGDSRVRGPVAVAEGLTVVIDRATDLDGDGVSDGFLNVRAVPVGSLSVTVEGAGAKFALDPAEVGAFSLGEGESATLSDLPSGFYTLTMTDLEDDLVLDAIDCGGDEIDVNLDNRSVNFAITGEDTVACTFAVSGGDDADSYDTYDDDPGDPDFDFDTPFGGADDPETSAPTLDPGSSTAGISQPPSAGDPASAFAGETAAPGPASEFAPAALTELPRTGGPARHLTATGVGLVVVGVPATLAGRRRRSLRQA